MGVEHGDHLHGQHRNEHKYDEADLVADGGDAGGFDRSSTHGYVPIGGGWLHNIINSIGIRTACSPPTCVIGCARGPRLIARLCASTRLSLPTRPLSWLMIPIHSWMRGLYPTIVIPTTTPAIHRSCVYLWGRDAGEGDDADGARDGPPSSRRPVAFTVDIAGGRRVAPKPVLSSEIAEVVVTEKRSARGQPSGGTAWHYCDGAVLSDQPHPPFSASLHAFFHTLMLHSISFTEIGSGRRRMEGWA